MMKGVYDRSILLEAQLAEEPLVLSSIVSLLKDLLDGLAGSNALRWLLEGFGGDHGLELDIEGISGGHEVVVVDDLHERLDLGETGSTFERLATFFWPMPLVILRG